MSTTFDVPNSLQRRQAWLLEQAQAWMECGYEVYCDWHAGLTLDDQELLDAEPELL